MRSEVRDAATSRGPGRSPGRADLSWIPAFPGMTGMAALSWIPACAGMTGGGAGESGGREQAARRGPVCVSQGRVDADRGDAGEPTRSIPAGPLQGRPCGAGRRLIRRPAHLAPPDGLHRTLTTVRDVERRAAGQRWRGTGASDRPAGTRSIAWNPARCAPAGTVVSRRSPSVAGRCRTFS